MLSRISESLDGKQSSFEKEKITTSCFISKGGNQKWHD